MTVTEATALYSALAMLTQQVHIMAEQGSQRGSGGGGDHYDHFKNLKIFSGDAKDFEEWSVKLRSLVAAADINVNKLMKVGGGNLYRRAVGEGVVQGVDP